MHQSVRDDVLHRPGGGLREYRPGARLVWMVWQGRDRNEWATVIRQALEPGVALSAEVPLAFSLGDPAVATHVLNASGFVSVEFAEVHEPVFYGADVDAAFEAVIGLQFAKDLLARPDTEGQDAEGQAARQRLRDLLETHLTADGVLFDSRAWSITAYRTKA